MKFAPFSSIFLGPSAFNPASAAIAIDNLDKFETFQAATRELASGLSQAASEDIQNSFRAIVAPLRESNFRTQRERLAHLIRDMPQQEWIRWASCIQQQSSLFPKDDQEPIAARTWSPHFEIRSSAAEESVTKYFIRVFGEVAEKWVALSTKQDDSGLFGRAAPLVHQSGLLDAQRIQVVLKKLKPDLAKPDRVLLYDSENGQPVISLGYRPRLPLPDAEELSLALLDSIRRMRTTVDVPRLEPADGNRLSLRKEASFPSVVRIQRALLGNAQVPVLIGILERMNLEEDVLSAVKRVLLRYPIRMMERRRNPLEPTELELHQQPGSRLYASSDRRSRSTLFIVFTRSGLDEPADSQIWNLIAQTLVLWVSEGTPKDVSWPLSWNQGLPSISINSVFHETAQHVTDVRIPPAFVKSMAHCLGWLRTLTQREMESGWTSAGLPRMEIESIRSLQWQEAQEKPSAVYNPRNDSVIVKSSLPELMAKAPLDWIEAACAVHKPSAWAWLRLLWNLDHTELKTKNERWHVSHASEETVEALARGLLRAQRFSKEATEAALQRHPHFFVEEARVERPASTFTLLKLDGAALIHFNGVAVFDAGEWNIFAKILVNAPDGLTWYTPNARNKTNRPSLLETPASSQPRSPDPEAVRVLQDLAKNAGIKKIPHDWTDPAALQEFRKTLILHYHPDRKTMDENEALSAMNSLQEAFKALNVKN